MATVNVEPHELSARWDELFALAQAGTEIIVMEKGAPAARLIPLIEGGARIAGLHAGMIEMADDFDAPLPDNFWTGEA